MSFQPLSLLFFSCDHHYFLLVHSYSQDLLLSLSFRRCCCSLYLDTRSLFNTFTHSFILLRYSHTHSCCVSISIQVKTNLVRVCTLMTNYRGSAIITSNVGKVALNWVCGWRVLAWTNDNYHFTLMRNDKD